MHKEDDEGDEGEGAENGRREVRVVDKFFGLVVEVQTVVQYWQNCHGIYEEDYCWKCEVGDGFNPVFRFGCEYGLEELTFDDLDWELEGKHHESWGEVGCKFEKGQVKELEPHEETFPFELIFSLLQGEDISVDLWFSVFHEIVDSFYGFDLGVDIGHEDHIFVVFMNSKAEDSVLSLIGVFIGQELLLGIWIDIVTFFPKSAGEEDSY